MSPRQVQAWLDALDDELGAIQATVEPLLTEQSRLQARRTLLKELLASFGDAQAASGDEAVGERGVTTGASTRADVGLETTRERVHRQALEIFRSAGRAMSVNELHAEFVARGFEIPGAGKPANITVHLTRWEDIVSPTRGVFALAEHAGTPTRRPVRRRGKSTRRG